MKKCCWYFLTLYCTISNSFTLLVLAIFRSTWLLFQAFSEKGYVKRMKPNTFNLQNRGTIGKSVGKLRVNDAMSDFLVCHAHDHVLYFRYLYVLCFYFPFSGSNSFSQFQALFSFAFTHLNSLVKFHVLCTW